MEKKHSRPRLARMKMRKRFYFIAYKINGSARATYLIIKKLLLNNFHPKPGFSIFAIAIGFLGRILLGRKSATITCGIGSDKAEGSVTLGVHLHIGLRGEQQVEITTAAVDGTLRVRAFNPWPSRMIDADVGY